MIERILIAHDGSDSARKAFDFAVELTARIGARRCIPWTSEPRSCPATPSG